MEIDKLYTVKEVSVLVAMAESTIWEHIRKGVFPKPIKRGRSSLWASSVIAEYVEQVKAGVYEYIPTEEVRSNRITL